MKIVDDELIEVEDNDIPPDGRFIIPETVKTIGPAVFANCDKLIAVAIPKGVTRIEASAFYSCSNLRSVSLPAGLAAIGKEAFRSCNNLSSLVIPPEVTTIGKSAFFGCVQLTTIVIPQGVTHIKEDTFYGCINLYSVSLPPGLITIANSAFFYCESLHNLIIPHGVTTIEEYAFSECKTLRTITLPQGVTISPFILNKCPKLEIIFVDVDNSEVLELIKEQLPKHLQDKVVSRGEYEIYETVQQKKSDVLKDTFKELLATNQITPLSTLFSPIIKLTFFSLLPIELLQELNLYKYTTYTSALLKLPDLHILLFRDEHGVINWDEYKTRFKFQFTKVLHTMLIPPTPEQAKAAPDVIAASIEEPRYDFLPSRPMM